MCGRTVDIQSATDENRRGNNKKEEKKKKETTAQDIMACPQSGHKIFTV